MKALASTMEGLVDLKANSMIQVFTQPVCWKYASRLFFSSCFFPSHLLNVCCRPQASLHRLSLFFLPQRESFSPAWKMELGHHTILISCESFLASLWFWACLFLCHSCLLHLPQLHRLRTLTAWYSKLWVAQRLPLISAGPLWAGCSAVGRMGRAWDRDGNSGCLGMEMITSSLTLFPAHWLAEWQSGGHLLVWISSWACCDT